MAKEFNNCNTPTQIAKLIKYLNEFLNTTVMTVPSAFLSFKTKVLMNILLFSTLLTSMPCVFSLCTALVTFFLNELFYNITTQSKALSNILERLVYLKCSHRKIIFKRIYCF